MRILCLTEQWRKQLDSHNIIGIVSMNLSKAFDTLPHDLIVAKLKSYGADDNTADLIQDYLRNRLQRIRLGDQFSIWQGISTGIPQGSVLGPLTFNIFMNDLVHVIKHTSLSAHADDTQISYTHSAPAKVVEEAINKDLANVDKWYEENKMKIEKHIAKVCRKISQQVAVLKRMKKMLPLETKRRLYHAFIIPHLDYCSETWHFCSKNDTAKLEKANERALRFVFNDNKRHTVNYLIR